MRNKKIWIPIALLLCALVCVAAGCTPAGDGDPKTQFVYIDASERALDAESATYADVIERVQDSVVEIATSSGAGSGVILNADGLIVTNHHVIENADAVAVKTTDGVEYAANIVGSDRKSDLAVLQIQAHDLTYAIIGDSEQTRVGERVLAIGNPLGTLGGSASEGIISAQKRNISVDGLPMQLMQTTAAINPGNSGGGLFNMSGQLIGIVNAKSTGIDVEGIGFAIPTDTAIPIVEELVSNGYIAGRPSLGVTVQFRNAGLSVYPVVIGVNDLQTSGLQVGDILYSIDNTVYTSAAAMQAYLLGAYNAGDTCNVTVIRGNEGSYTQIKLQVKLIDAHENL